MESRGKERPNIAESTTSILARRRRCRRIIITGAMSGTVAERTNLACSKLISSGEEGSNGGGGGGGNGGHSTTVQTHSAKKDGSPQLPATRDASLETMGGFPGIGPPAPPTPPIFPPPIRGENTFEFPAIARPHGQSCCARTCTARVSTGVKCRLCKGNLPYSLHPLSLPPFSGHFRQCMIFIELVTKK